MDARLLRVLGVAVLALASTASVPAAHASISVSPGVVKLVPRSGTSVQVTVTNLDHKQPTAMRLGLRTYRQLASGGVAVTGHRLKGFKLDRSTLSLPAGASGAVKVTFTGRTQTRRSIYGALVVHSKPHAGDGGRAITNAEIGIRAETRSGTSKVAADSVFGAKVNRLPVLRWPVRNSGTRMGMYAARFTIRTLRGRLVWRSDVTAMALPGSRITLESPGLPIKAGRYAVKAEIVDANKTKRNRRGTIDATRNARVRLS